MTYKSTKTKPTTPTTTKSATIMSITKTSTKVVIIVMITTLNTSRLLTGPCSQLVLQLLSQQSSTKWNNYYKGNYTAAVNLATKSTTTTTIVAVTMAK
jgi:hypothetical protein